MLPNDEVTWSELADMLNRTGVMNPLGKVWRGQTLSVFVKVQHAMGEKVTPLKRDRHRRLTSARMRELQTRRGREVQAIKREKARAQRAGDIRQHCSGATSYAEGAAILNRHGCGTKAGDWTASRLCDFVRRYRKQKGEDLMPKARVITERTP